MTRRGRGRARPRRAGSCRTRASGRTRARSGRRAWAATGIRCFASRSAIAACEALGWPRSCEILGRRRLELGHERLVVGAIGGVVVDLAQLARDRPVEDDGVDREQPPDAQRGRELRVELRRADVAERDRRLVELPRAEELQRAEGLELAELDADAVALRHDPRSGSPRSAGTARARPAVPPAARSAGTGASGSRACAPRARARAGTRDRPRAPCAGAAIAIAPAWLQRRRQLVPGRAPARAQARPQRARRASVRSGVENSIRATTIWSRVFARSGSSGQSRSASATRISFGGPLTGSGAACCGADDDEQPAAARASTASAAARRPRTT